MPHSQSFAAAIKATRAPTNPACESRSASSQEASVCLQRSGDGWQLLWGAIKCGESADTPRRLSPTHPVLASGPYLLRGNVQVRAVCSRVSGSGPQRRARTPLDRAALSSDGGTLLIPFGMEILALVFTKSSS